mmetsp:Transcript_37450/g.80837  ORF Transcript_37450/g.80837 Transcript_37450/m.80837 type:complete len:369 (+) Transcript_37450:90-1196(+)
MAPIQEEEDSTFTLSIGGVEFCLTPSPDVDDDDDRHRDNDSMMSVSKIRNGEVLINLTNFVGTLRVKNYNIDVAGLPTSNMPSVYGGNNSNNRYSSSNSNNNTGRGRKRTASGSGNDNADDDNNNNNDHHHPKKKRINHSKDNTMKNAVEEWFRIKGTEGAPSRAKFARSRGIKPSSFSQYACDDPSKRRKLGARVGRTSLVSEQVSELLAQHFSLTNPNGSGNNEDEDEDGNDVVTNTPREVVEGLMQLQPELTMEQATNYVNRTWRRKHQNTHVHHNEEQQGQGKDEDNEDNEGGNEGENSGNYGGGNGGDYGGRLATYNRNRGDEDLMLRHGHVPELPPHEHQHHYPHHRHHGLPKREHDYNDWS